MSDNKQDSGEDEPLMRVLQPALGKAITRHATFRWMEAEPERECGARGWEAGPGTHIDIPAIAAEVLDALGLEPFTRNREARLLRGLVVALVSELALKRDNTGTWYADDWGMEIVLSEEHRAVLDEATRSARSEEESP